MDETKLTVRVPRELVDRAKHHASQNNTTLTNLIVAYLLRLPSHQMLDQAPIVQRLSGTLSSGVVLEDYHKHLDEKYGQ